LLENENMNRHSHRQGSPAVTSRDWGAIEKSLDADGNAVLTGLLTPSECGELAAAYSQENRFRTRIDMARHGFGLGEYKYFAYPLPEALSALRESLYPPLSAIANRWQTRMGRGVIYPPSLTGFLDLCHGAGQTRPTPLILRYKAGDYNCLHQDLYGELAFPLQVAILLSRPGIDFDGGEFVMTEVEASRQRIQVVPLRQGDAVIFTVNERPIDGRRGTRTVRMRHGVSKIHSGNRLTVGLIFHDAL
jgi:hypothetical protein